MSKGKNRSQAEGPGPQPIPAGFAPLFQKAATITALPDPRGGENSLIQTVLALKERSHVQSRDAGDYFDSFVTVRDLVRLNLVTFDGQQARDDYTAWNMAGIPTQQVNLPGAATDPTRDSTTGAVLFSGAASNQFFVFLEFPHDWLERSYVVPYILWQKTTSASGNVEWTLEYKSEKLDQIMPASWTPHATTTTVGDGTTDSDTADKVLCTNFGQLDASGYAIRDGVLFKIKRDPTQPNDTYGADARLLSFGLRYQIDAHGSLSQLDKLGAR